MILQRSARNFILITICLLCVRCATVSSPTGGPKDEAPPVMLNSSIDNGSTNFDGNTITLEFNEWIKIDNPSQNIYSSPPLGNDVSYVPRKEKLFVIFEEPLEENTTYHLNFGNSIRDVNEGNPLNNFQFVFATGDVIDSLFYQGNLNVINELEITDNTLIGLYKMDSLALAEGDSLFMKYPPFYFTFVQDNGNFLLDYLKTGEYLVFALTDRNSNYYYDLPNEAIGFIDSVLILTDHVMLAEVPLFLPEPSETRVKSFDNTIDDYKINYELGRAIPDRDSLVVETISDSIDVPVYFKISEDRKLITAWLGKELDGATSIKTVLKWNNIPVDTFEHSIADLKLPKLEIELQPRECTRKDSLIVSLSNPVASICENIARIDTLTGDTLALFVRKHSDFQLVIPKITDANENVVYTLLTTDSCLADIYGQFRTLTGQVIKIVPEEDRGSLTLRFVNIDPSISYLVELQKEGKKVRSITIDSLQDKLKIANLVPGNYLLQIIEDENRNGVWNSGSLIPRKLPERIYSYPKEFILRPNWEMEESINLSAP
jgi:hypothetical protein